MKGPQKDTGFAWVVCAASFVAHALHCNLLYSRGMFYIIFRREFTEDSGAISLIPSINSALTFGFGLFVARFGARAVGILGGLCTSAGLILASRATELYHLYLTYGVLTGIGIAFIFNPCITVLPAYFEKRLGMAVGIAVSGCGAGFVAFQYIIKCLDDSYGWRGTLLILGAIQLHCVALALLYNNGNALTKDTNIPLDMKGTEKDGILETSLHSATDQRGENSNVDVHDSCLPQDHPAVQGESLITRMKTQVMMGLATLRALGKNPTYTLFTLGQLFSVTADSIIYTHFGAFALSVGHNTGNAALLFTIVGITNTLMRVLSGLAAQKIHPLLLCCAGSVILAVCTMTLYVMKSMALLVLYAACFGGFCAPYHSSPILVTSEVIQPKMLPLAIGIQTAILAPGSLLGPLMAGVLYDYTEVYQTSFYMASGFLVLASASALAPLVIRRFYGTDSQKTFAFKDV